MKGKDVSQMQQAKFPLEVNGVASNLNRWISDEDQSQEPTWHIEKLIHPCLKLEKERKNVKKNTVYRSIKFWLSFLFPITSNTLYSSVLLMSGLFCRSQFMYFAGHIMLECLLSDFFFISANWQFCPYIAAYEFMFIFLIVSRYMDHFLRIHFIGRQHSETARAQQEKQENMWTWNIGEISATLWSKLNL